MRPCSIFLSLWTLSSPSVQKGEHAEQNLTAYDVWLASRAINSTKELLVPGAQRPLTIKNTRLAYLMVKKNALGLVCWNASKHLPRQLISLLPSLNNFVAIIRRGQHLC